MPAQPTALGEVQEPGPQTGSGAPGHAQQEALALTERWLRLALTQPIAALWGPDLFPMVRDFLLAFAGPQPEPRPGPEVSVPFTFSIQSSIDFQHGRWTVEGPTGWILPRLLQLMGEKGVPDEMLESLRQAGETLNPETLAVWLQGSTTGAELGWSILPPLFFHKLRPLNLKTPGFRVLQRWAQASSLVMARRFGSSMSEAPMTELQVELPRASLEASWRAGQSLCVALQTPELPEAARHALDITGKKPSEASIWLAGEETLKVGLVVRDPGTTLLLRLADLVPIRDLEPVAALEGTLNKQGPTWLELQELAGALGVVVGYELEPLQVG